MFHLKILFLSTLFYYFSLIVLAKSCENDWWKHAVLYQVYPRSFKDSNNDGNGDLDGVIEKIPHFVDAGITAIWLSPILKSPLKEGGYDISDYYQVNEIYGSIKTLKRLIRAVHDHGLKIVLDFVPNHTSNQSKWFELSEKKIDPYTDYYVWENSKNGKEPNNWVSIATDGTAWKWSEKRKQYYLHQFLDLQVDLNFRNPKVHEEMKNVLLHYLDMGMDGFRIDAAGFIYEDELLRDEPEADNTTPNNQKGYKSLKHIYTLNQPKTYDLIEEWRTLVDDYSKKNGGDARVLMTEVYTDLNDTVYYYGNPDGTHRRAHLSFNFIFITDLDQNKSNAHDVVRIVQNWQKSLAPMYTSNWVLGNHDNRRYPTRLGKANKDGFNMLNLLLPGIAVTYNGEEFGQEDGPITFAQNEDPLAPDEATYLEKSRDFERTPLQWDNTVNAGFNKGAKPWLPVSPAYKELNLASQMNTSVLSHYQIYRSLTRIRKRNVVRYGSLQIESLSVDVFAMRRTWRKESLLLVFKLGWNREKEREFVRVPGVNAKKAKVILTNVDSRRKIGSSIDPRKFHIRAHESLLMDISG